MNPGTDAGALAGKVALVTGGSRGIGAATARLLARRGAQVAVGYRANAEAAQAVVDEIRGAGGTAEAFCADVAEAEQARGLVAATVARFGRIDVLVNNAGVFVVRPLPEVDADLFHRLFDTNVLGPLQLIQACLPHLPPTGGRIINVISTLAVTPSEGSTLYAATKAALRAITQGYVDELGRRGATINAVAPGVTLTDMMAGVPEAALERVAATTAAGRVGVAEDIAPIIAFLASEDSAWLTGRTLAADGGRIIF